MGRGEGQGARRGRRDDKGGNGKAMTVVLWGWRRGTGAVGWQAGCWKETDVLCQSPSSLSLSISIEVPCIIKIASVKTRRVKEDTNARSQCYCARGTMSATRPPTCPSHPEESVVTASCPAARGRTCTVPRPWRRLGGGCAPVSGSRRHLGACGVSHCCLCSSWMNR